MAVTEGPEGNVEQLANRVRELNEQIIGLSMQAGEATLSAYARMLQTIAELQDNVGQASPAEWLTKFTTAQANLTRDLAESYTTAARRFAK